MTRFHNIPHRVLAFVLALASSLPGAPAPGVHQAEAKTSTTKQALPASRKLSPAQKAFMATPYENAGVALPPWVDARGRLLRQVRR